MCVCVQETVKDVIRYEATTSNNKFMVGNTLVITPYSPQSLT